MSLISDLGGGAIVIGAIGRGLFYLVGLYKERKAAGDKERAEDKKADEKASRDVIGILTEQLKSTQERAEEQIKRLDDRADREIKAREDLAKVLADVAQGMKDLGRIAVEHSTADRADHQRIFTELASLRASFEAFQHAFEIFIARQGTSLRPVASDGSATTPTTPTTPTGSAP